MSIYLKPMRRRADDLVGAWFGRDHRQARVLILVAAISAVALVAATVVLLVQARKATWDRARSDMANVVAMMKADMARTIASYDLALQSVVTAVESQDFSTLSDDIREAYILSATRSARHLSVVRVLDATAHLVLTSEITSRGVQTGDWEAFFQHLGRRSDTLHIGPPMKNDDGVFTVTLSRRFETRDGRFAGVVVGHLSLNYFAQMMENIRVEKDGALSVIYAHSQMVYRFPDGAAATGRDISRNPLTLKIQRARENWVEGVPSRDAVHRLFVFDRVEGTPFQLTMGRSTQSISREFWQGAVWPLVLVALLLLVQVGLSVGLTDEFRGRLAAEKKLESTANTDALTSLANRRRFNEVIDQRWADATATQTPLAMLMIDADYFKKYNDHYGHPAGDRLLELIGRCVARSIRGDQDLAARFGGEEFAVIIPGLSAEAAMGLAERIRHRVEVLGEPHADHPLRKASVSIGVASLVPTAGVGGSDDLIAAADHALYDAKHRGRNRCEMFSDHDEGEKVAA